MHELKFNLEDRKKFVLNSIVSKTNLDAKNIEFLLVLTENFNTKLSNVKILDDIIDLIIEYNKIKLEKENLWKNLVKLIDINVDSNAIRYSADEMMILMQEYIDNINKKYLFRQIDRVNNTIKEEIEVDYNKRINYYKELYSKYKCKYNTLLCKANQTFPNKSFQYKVHRKLNVILSNFYRIKNSIYKGQYGKCIGICYKNIKFIGKLKENIKQDGLEDGFIQDKLILNEEVDNLVSNLDSKYQNIYENLSQEDTMEITNKIIKSNANKDIKLMMITKFLDGKTLINDQIDEIENNNTILNKNISLDDNEINLTNGKKDIAIGSSIFG